MMMVRSVREREGTSRLPGRPRGIFIALNLLILEGGRKVPRNQNDRYFDPHAWRRCIRVAGRRSEDRRAAAGVRGAGPGLERTHRRPAGGGAGRGGTP